MSDLYLPASDGTNEASPNVPSPEVQDKAPTFHVASSDSFRPPPGLGVMHGDQEVDSCLFRLLPGRTDSFYELQHRCADWCKPNQMCSMGSQCEQPVLLPSRMIHGFHCTQAVEVIEDFKWMAYIRIVLNVPYTSRGRTLVKNTRGGRWTEHPQSSPHVNFEPGICFRFPCSGHLLSDCAIVVVWCPGSM